MEEIKVIGASPMNLNGIRLGLTVPGPETKNGEPIPDLQYEENEELQADPINHPFRLAIALPPSNDTSSPTLIYDHNYSVSGVIGIHIDKTMIQINAQTKNSIQIQEYDWRVVPVSGLSENGEYSVILAIKYNYSTTLYEANIYFTQSYENDPGACPGLPGFQTIKIGKIKRETFSDSVFYSIKEQSLHSTFFFDGASLVRPFSITAYSDEFQNGSVRNSFQEQDFRFHVKEGNVLTPPLGNIGSPSIIYISSHVFTLSFPEDAYVYCSIYEDPVSGRIEIDNDTRTLHDYENKKWNYLIGHVWRHVVGGKLQIDQYITDTFSMVGGGSYKVKVNTNDQSPDFLSRKISSSGSITIDDSSNSYVQLDINGSHFFSSDRSIIIDENVNGLDYSINQEQLSGAIIQNIASVSGIIEQNITNSVTNLISNVSSTIQQNVTNEISNVSSIIQQNVTNEISNVSSTLQQNFNTQISNVSSTIQQNVTNQISTVSSTIQQNITNTVTNQISAVSSTIEQNVTNNVTNQMQNIVSSYIQNNSAQIVSALFPQGTGLLKIAAGQLSVIPIGTGVAVGGNGTLTFEEPEDCD